MVCLIIICPYYFQTIAHIPGELDRKSVAAAFWEQELYQELSDIGIENKWEFTCKQATKDHADGNKLMGSKEDAIQYIVQKRVHQTYTHECYEGCKSKGNDMEV